MYRRFTRVKHIRSNIDNKLYYGHHSFAIVINILVTIIYIIKFIEFEPIYYSIKLDIVSNSMIFNEFIHVFICIISFESIKISLLKNNL